MSKSKEIKKVIMDILQDGNIHTAEEIRTVCARKGIIDIKESNVVRGAIFTLKKENECFVAVDKGKYKLRRINDVEESIVHDEFDKVIKYLEKKVNVFKRFNWITCTDEELEIARKQITVMMNLADDIKKIASI